MPKSKHQVPGRVRSIYAFIKAHRDQYSVQMMCRILGVAVSGYYLWLQQPISNHDQEDARLLRLIRASFVASHGIYGAPRVFLDEPNKSRRVLRPRRGGVVLRSCAVLPAYRVDATIAHP